MGTSFYDYKKNRYQILEQYADDYYLVKSDKKEEFYIIEADNEFLSSARPIKSVFNKFDSDKMYDIKGIYGDGVEESKAMNQWNLLKAEIDNIITEQLDKDAELQREEAAIASGWAPIKNYRYSIENDTDNLIISDIDNNRNFTVTSSSSDIEYKKLSSDDMDLYSQVWVNGYNTEYGDKKQAQENADNTMRAWWTCEKLYQNTSAQDLSRVFTQELIHNIDNQGLPNTTNENFAQFTANSFVMLEFMRSMQIPLFSDEKLLGKDVNNLDYDYMNIISRLNSRTSERLEVMHKELSGQVNEYCKQNSIEILADIKNAVPSGNNNFILKDNDDIRIDAINVIDSNTGLSAYQLEARMKNEPILSDPIIIGSCRQSDISKLGFTKASSWDNIDLKTSSKSAEGAKHKTNENFME